METRCRGLPGIGWLALCLASRHAQRGC